MPPQLDALGILAKAGSKEFVEDVVVDLFRLRDAAGFPEPRCAELCEVLGVGRSEVDLMFTAGKFVVRECAYGGVSCHTPALLAPAVIVTVALLTSAAPSCCGAHSIEFEGQKGWVSTSSPKGVTYLQPQPH